MSKFNTYAKQLDDLAHRTFDKISEVETAFQTAKDDYNSLTPSNTPEAQARPARLKARFLEAEDAVRTMNKNLPGEVANKAAAIRAELASAIRANCAVDPAKIDLAAVELLKSGIMTADDYGSLYNKAKQEENTTMQRLIASYAGKSAEDVEARNGRRDPAVAALRGIKTDAQFLDGRAYLESFDALSDTLRRSVNNHSMVKFWDQLTSEAISNF